MAAPVLHCFHTTRRLFRTEHVRGSRGGELPQMSRGTREGRESATSCQKSASDGEETEK